VSLSSLYLSAIACLRSRRNAIIRSTRRHRSISLCCISLMTTLMCSIPHLMASVDSSKASFSVQQEHVEESGGGCGESQEEVGESEEGVEGTGAVEVTGGGGGGGWQGGDGLSLGVKSREFPRLLNHSTLQAKGFDSGDKSGVLSRMGGTKVKVGVGATVKVGVEANSVTGGEPRPLAPLPLAAYQVVPLLDLPLSRGIEIST
jgi:hypothetical protein